MKMIMLDQDPPPCWCSSTRTLNRKNLCVFSLNQETLEPFYLLKTRADGWGVIACWIFWFLFGYCGDEMEEISWSAQLFQGSDQWSDLTWCDPGNINCSHPWYWLIVASMLGRESHDFTHRLIASFQNSKKRKVTGDVHTPCKKSYI